MKLLATLLLAAALSSAQSAQTFTGVVTDDECARGDHSAMKMGPTDAECTKMCVMHHGAQYVLFDGTTAYVLSDQKKPEAFAGQRVRVTGTLNAASKTIHVASIAAE